MPILVILAAAVIGMTGCDGAPAPSTKSTNDIATDSPEEPPVTPRPSTTQETGSSDLAVTTDESGRKWLTPEIPYDVFPDLPSAAELIASQGETASGPIAVGPPVERAADTPPAGMAATEEPMPPGEAVATANPPVASPASPGIEAAADALATDWGTILPVQVFDDEISDVRNRLAQNLLTVGSFNRAFAEVARDGWEMSALATIAAEHPGTFSWKPNALLARDAAISIAQAATGRGRENFKKAELGGEQVSAVLNNNAPAGMDAPKADVSREKTADRGALMSRIQIAYDRLRELSVSEAALRENRDDLDRQARVLAAMGKFIAHPDYPGAENDDYQTQARKLVAAAIAMAQSTENEDLAKFQTAWNQAGTACSACHQKYR